MATQNETKSQEKVATKMSKADAAKLVKRMVPVFNDKKEPEVDKDGNQRLKPAAISEDEVMSFAEYPDRVVVVTTSGEKLSAKK